MSLLAIPALEKSPQSRISDRFARAPYFYIYDSEQGTGTWMDNGIMDAHGAGTKAVQALASAGVKTVAAVNLGDNAARALEQAGIGVFFADRELTVDSVARTIPVGKA